MDATDAKAAMTGKSYLVRLYEANCGIQFPTENDIRFRDGLANSLTRELNVNMPKGSSPAPTAPASTTRRS